MKYPEQYNNCCITLFYNLVRFYSKCQIKFGQLIKYVKYIKYIKEIPVVQYITDKTMTLTKIIFNSQATPIITLEFIVNSKRSNTLYFNNEKEINAYINNKTEAKFEYDFIIATQHQGPQGNNNKRIITNINDWDNCFEESKAIFFLTEVIIDNDMENVVKIDFKRDYYNYYLANNRFDEQFIKFFLVTGHCFNLEKLDTQHIEIRILDQNFKQINYDIKKDYIHLTKTNYFRKTDIIVEEEESK